MEVLTAYFLISIWGRPNSERNAFQFILFAALSGLLFLTALSILYFQTGAHSLELSALKISLSEAPGSFRAVFLILLGSLSILSALFPFHAWGPLGYQAAPRGVNTLLVGVIKKAGPYLFIRLALGLFPQELRQFATPLIILCLINILYVGWIAMNQKDPKLMAGYSSSSHMGYILLGILSFSPIGLVGALILSFAHGLTASLLFSSVGRVETQTGPFQYGEVAGIGSKTPFLHFVFSAAALASAGLPGFANFTGEILIFFSLLKVSIPALFLAIFGALLSAVYLLRAIKNIFHGFPVHRPDLKDESFFGKLASGLALAGLLILGILPLPFIHWIVPQATRILEGIL
jgi:NADH-quinone oxidoreductase subunit M